LTGIRPDQVTDITVRTVSKPQLARYLRDLSTQGGSTLEINYAISFIMEELGYPDPDAAFSAIMNELKSSVNGTTFNELLQKFGFPAAVAVSGLTFGKETVVIIRSAQPSIEPSMNPSPVAEVASNSSRKTKVDLLPVYIVVAVVGFGLLVMLAGLFVLRCVDHSKWTSKYKSVEGAESEAANAESRTDGSTAGIVDWLLPDRSAAAEEAQASDAKKNTSLMTYISEMTLFPSASKMRDKLPDNKEDVLTAVEEKTDDPGTSGGGTAGMSEWMFPDPAVTSADNEDPESPSKKKSMKKYFSGMVLFRSPSKSNDKQADVSGSVSEPVTIVGTSEAAEWMFPEAVTETENSQSALDRTNAESGVVHTETGDTGGTTMIMQTIEPAESEALATNLIIDVVSSTLALMVPDAMVREVDDDVDSSGAAASESRSVSTNNEASSNEGSAGKDEETLHVNTGAATADSTTAGSPLGESTFAGESTVVNSIIDTVSSTIAMMVPDAMVGDADTAEQDSGLSAVAQSTPALLIDTAVTENDRKHPEAVKGSTPRQKSSKKLNVLKLLRSSTPTKQLAATEEPATSTGAVSNHIPAAQKDGTAALQTPLIVDTHIDRKGSTAERASMIDVVSSTIAMMVPDSLISFADDEGIGKKSSGVIESSLGQPTAIGESVHSTSKGNKSPEVLTPDSQGSPNRASSGNVSLANWLFPSPSPTVTSSGEPNEGSELESAVERKKKSPLQLGLFKSASKRDKSPDPSGIQTDEVVTTTSSVFDTLSSTIAMIIPDAALGDEGQVDEEIMVEPAKKPFLRRQLQNMFRRDPTEYPSMPHPPTEQSNIAEVGIRGSASSDVTVHPPAPQANGSIVRKASTTTFQRPKSGVNKSIKFDASTK